MAADRHGRSSGEGSSNHDDSNKRHQRFLAGSGPAQQQAEVVLLEALSEKLGVSLQRKRFDLDDGWFEVDGADEVGQHVGFASPANAKRLGLLVEALGG